MQFHSSQHRLEGLVVRVHTCTFDIDNATDLYTFDADASSTEATSTSSTI